MSRVVDLWHTKDPVTGKKTKTDRYGKGSRWQAVWTNGRGGEVKKSHRTKDAAWGWIADQDALHRRGYTPGGPKTLVREAAQKWVTANIDWEPKSQHTVAHVLENHILPAFGDVPLDELTRQQVREWVYEMSTRYAPNTTLTYFGRFRTFMLWCVEEKLIPESPTNGVKVPKGKPRKHYYLTPEQFWNLHQHMHPHFQEAMEFAVTAGPRPGELWEFRGRDVGQLPGRIAVERAVTDVGGVITLGDTKTDEPRLAPLLPHIERMLLRRAREVGPDGLLFQSTQGKQVDQSNFNTRYWKKAVIAAGLPQELRLYDLRHTAASWAIREGASVLAVQRMLGHSTPTETLNTYAHLFDDELDQVTASISKMLRRDRKKSRERKKRVRHKTAQGRLDAA